MMRRTNYTGATASIQQSQPVIRVLKKEQQSQLYSLDSATQLTRSGRGGMVNYAAQSSAQGITSAASGLHGRLAGGAGVGSKRTHQQIDSSLIASGIEVKKEIVGPQQITRIRRGAPEGQENEIGSTNGGPVDEEMADSDGGAGVEGELNEETQTKADENEQFLLQQEYSKTAFIIPSCSGWFNIDSIHEIEM